MKPHFTEGIHVMHMYAPETMTSSEMYDWNETVSDQELLQIPTEMFEWDEVKSDQELPTKMFEWNEEVSDEELTKEMTEWNEVVCDEELMNIPLEFFVPNDCESVEMDLGDSELIQGFLDCDSWDWDASTFDYERNLFQICCAKNKWNENKEKWIKK